jgi:hypothetical protein
MSETSWLMSLITINTIIILSCMYSTETRLEYELKKIHKEVIKLRNKLDEDAAYDLMYERTEFMDKVTDYKLTFTEIK